MILFSQIANRHQKQNTYTTPTKTKQNKWGFTGNPRICLREGAGVVWPVKFRPCSWPDQAAVEETNKTINDASILMRIRGTQTHVSATVSNPPHHAKTRWKRFRG